MASEKLSDVIKSVESYVRDFGPAAGPEILRLVSTLRECAKLMRDLRPFILQMGAYRAEDMAKRMGDMADEIDPPTKGGKP